MAERDLVGGLVRRHILHHASREAVFGLWLIEELGHHGYRLSPGTLYPILHALERNGYLASSAPSGGGRNRRTYVATPEGREALRLAKAKVWELFREFFEDELAFAARPGTNARPPTKAKPRPGRSVTAAGVAPRKKPGGKSSAPRKAPRAAKS
jgi:DNA-binding PadR family transcriptional regulator